MMYADQGARMNVGFDAHAVVSVLADKYANGEGMGNGFDVENARYNTGHDLVVDGGTTCSMGRT